MRMAAVAAKQIRTGFERIQQVKGGNGAARAVCLISVARDHQRRASVAFHHSRGGNSADAAMPASSIDHRAECLSKRGLLLDAQLNRVHDAAFFFLTFGVELVYSISNFARSGRILHAEKIDYVPRNIHAPSRI